MGWTSPRHVVPPLGGLILQRDSLLDCMVQARIDSSSDEEEVAYESDYDEQLELMKQLGLPTAFGQSGVCKER